MSKKLIILSIFLIASAACSKETSNVITAAGVIDGEVITLKSPVTGKVKMLNITEGNDVLKEDILVVVDSDKIENQIEGLEIQGKEIVVSRNKLERKIRMLNAQFVYWKKQVESFERLEGKESISADQLEKARLQLDEVETSLFDAQQSLRALSIQSENIQNRKEYLNLLLEDHIIASPVAGVILEKFVSEGETLFPGAPVADILDRSSLYVETFLEEPELSRLELGREVDVLVDGMEGKTYTGTITYFGQKAEFSPKYIISEKERRSLLYRVKVGLSGDLEVFKLGMPVTVRIGNHDPSAE